MAEMKKEKDGKRRRKETKAEMTDRKRQRGMMTEGDGNKKTKAEMTDRTGTTPSYAQPVDDRLQSGTTPSYAQPVDDRLQSGATPSPNWNNFADFCRQGATPSPNWNNVDDRIQQGMAAMVKEEMTDRSQRVVDSKLLIPHDMAMTSEDQTTDIQLPVLPLSSEGDLTTLETYLKKCNEIVNEILLEKLTSVKCIKNYTDNVLNAMMTPELASNYTWKGKTRKKAFKDLRLFEFVIKAVREEYPDATYSDIENSIKPWLTTAPKKNTPKKKNT